MQVKYGREHEQDAIQDINGGSADINKDFKGEYVEPHARVSAIRRSNMRANLPNNKLARFVYLHVERNLLDSKPITSIGLRFADEGSPQGNMAKGAGGNAAMSPLRII